MTSLPGAVVKTSLPGFTYNDVMPNVFYAAITRDSIRDNLVQLRSFFGAPAGVPAFFPSDNFRANEKSYAAYGQLKYGFDLGSTVIDGLVGLRRSRQRHGSTVSRASRLQAARSPSRPSPPRANTPIICRTSARASPSTTSCSCASLIPRRAPGRISSIFVRTRRWVSR
jgi:hypothetical protein